MVNKVDCSKVGNLEYTSDWSMQPVKETEVGIRRNWSFYDYLMRLLLDTIFLVCVMRLSGEKSSIIT